MTASLAAMTLELDREHYPYDSAALKRLPESRLARETERFGVSSPDALGLAHDLLEDHMAAFERSLVSEFGAQAGRDLSGVHVRHVFIASPNAIPGWPR